MRTIIISLFNPLRRARSPFSKGHARVLTVFMVEFYIFPVFFFTTPRLLRAIYIAPSNPLRRTQSPPPAAINAVNLFKTPEEFVLELLAFRKEDLQNVEGKQAAHTTPTYLPPTTTPEGRNQWNASRPRAQRTPLIRTAILASKGQKKRTQQTRYF